VDRLRPSHVKLTERADELISSMNPFWVYTPKSGYLAISSEGGQRNAEWWWRKVRKFKCPSKAKKVCDFN
jgi:hypothetical protein